jgi:iron complex transport system substrate-binding protein
MRSFVFTVIAVCTFVFLFPSCDGEGNRAETFQGDTLEVRYASHLQMVECMGYTLVNLRNPWDTLRTLHSYILMPRDKEYNTDTLPKGTVVRVPLQRSVIYTSVHCGLVNEWGALDGVAGVCDVKYIHQDEVLQRLADGRMTDLGNAQSPDVERMIDIQPDALLLSPFENSGGYGMVERLGVPIIECADYMETSALGRAEWMRFYGRLYGCGDKADSLFANVEADYLKWKDKALACTDRPTVFADLPTGISAWYVSGGGSTIGRMYADAGARYLFADNASTGSVPLSFETVYAKAKHADIWLIRYHAPQDRTYRSLANEFELCTNFDAFRNRRMYGCNTAYSRFYDEIPFHPERLLAEFACIFHPELKCESGWKNCYYFPLKD